MLHGITSLQNTRNKGEAGGAVRRLTPSVLAGACRTGLVQRCSEGCSKFTQRRSSERGGRRVRGERAAAASTARSGCRKLCFGYRGSGLRVLMARTEQWRGGRCSSKLLTLSLAWKKLERGLLHRSATYWLILTEPRSAAGVVRLTCEGARGQRLPGCNPAVLRGCESPLRRTPSWCPVVGGC